jgi:hypothetical protein
LALIGGVGTYRAPLPIPAAVQVGALSHSSIQAAVT